MWYRHHIGHDNCPIVDTWWQTETGAIMISPLPGVTATKPGSAMTPLPGISAKVVNDEGVPVGKGEGGYLVIDRPWPAMLRTILGDDERYKDTYWSRFAAQGYYFAGDGAKYDTDGALWLLGRVDDVMNVSGHRISTTEVESALVSHPSVAEAAVVGATDEMTGQGIVAFVILRGAADSDGPGSPGRRRCKKHVAKEIGPIAKPKRILVVPELPKTRSGKIMRRLLRDVAENRAVGRRHHPAGLDRAEPDLVGPVGRQVLTMNRSRGTRLRDRRTSTRPGPGACRRPVTIGRSREPEAAIRAAPGGTVTAMAQRPALDTPVIIVLFGATGDLAKRMVLPAFYTLAEQQLMPENYLLIGTGRGEVTDEQFRQHIHDALTEFATAPDAGRLGRVQRPGAVRRRRVHRRRPGRAWSTRSPRRAPNWARTPS